MPMIGSVLNEMKGSNTGRRSGSPSSRKWKFILWCIFSLLLEFIVVATCKRGVRAKYFALSLPTLLLLLLLPFYRPYASNLRSRTPPV